MKRAIVLAAGAVVLAANLWVVLSARQNQSATPGGTAELTERELRLSPISGDSTAIVLELKWDVRTADAEHDRSPDWLNVAKLGALGFDCHVAATDRQARDHYASISPALVYLVLEYEGEAWKATRPDRRRTTRLFVVDAGRDARRLREQYPDSARQIITRGVVRPFLQDRSQRDGAPLAPPRLRGRIEAVLPDRIFVPQPHSKTLQSLARDRDQHNQDPRGDPRFAVTVAWGARYEPWVQDVRLLPASGSGQPSRE